MIDRHLMLNLNGSTYELKPTLDAMRKINRHFDSLSDALVAVRRLDFDGICHILVAGAGLDAKRGEQLVQDVFEAGVTNVVGEAADYITMLLDPTGASEEETDPKNP